MTGVFVTAHTALKHVIDTIGNIDRPGDASADGTYAEKEATASEYDPKTGLWFPRAKASASTGLGRAQAEWSIFHAEARGPNAGAKAEACIDGVSAFARAEVARASATAGPVKATVRVGLENGGKVGVTGVEAKLLGNGFSFGRKMGVSVCGFGFDVELC